MEERGCMDKLKERILKEGIVFQGNIIKVDGFLNHQIDVELLNEIGKAFYERFKDIKIDKILTIEASGIAIAVITAQYFKVPVVFAKKSESKLTSDHQWVTSIHSYTKDKTSRVQVSQSYLKENEAVLIIDDFLANGEAAFGLMDLIKQAKAHTAGIGIVIEKGFQDGGKRLRDQKIHLESLAIIESMDEKGIIFR
jgi:xanthine phosphoribosyltransferase